jgi:hypothetical protein
MIDHESVEHINQGRDQPARNIFHIQPRKEVHKDPRQDEVHDKLKVDDLCGKMRKKGDEDVQRIKGLILGICKKRISVKEKGVPQREKPLTPELTRIPQRREKLIRGIP